MPHTVPQRRFAVKPCGSALESWESTFAAAHIKDDKAMTAPGDSYAGPAGQVPLGTRLAAAREHAAAGLRAGMSGVELADGLTGEVEAMVVELVAFHLGRAGLSASSGLAVLATGGFGRRELAPHSDLDLVFLCAEPPDAAVEEVARAILHPLWDAKIDAGHAVRSLGEAVELPASDLTAATALLDARYLAGDRALADRFLALYGARVAGASPDGFVARLRAEQSARHSRFGDTIFLLEPDLKNGPGGIRDLCVGRWAALARFGTGQARALQDLGEMSARQAAAFEAARDWLLKVRVALHLAAGRRQDQLRFDLQEKIALGLYGHVRVPPGDIRPAVAPAVEALMHHFQRHAKAISRETERLLLRASADPRHEPLTVPVALGPSGEVDPSFELRDRALEVKDPAVFARKPSEMIRLFCASIELDVPVGLRTADLVAEHAAHHGPALREDRDAGPRFLELCTDVRDRATPSRLEQMQDLGLLAALMPEWEPVTGRVQHDIYHVYTVDRHSLYAIVMLKALARGDSIDEHPLATEQARSVARPGPLYLATLLHDVGKPLGRNHSAKGAVVGGAIAARLGLGREDVRQVEFMIREHLTMGHTSQRRDLDDPALIAHFARLCGDEEGLRELYLITFCDLASTAPGNLTGWKNGLLRDLFQRTLTYLRRGPDLLHTERQQLLQRRQRQTAERLGEHPDSPAIGALFRTLPDRYFMESSVARIASHVRLIRERTGSCALQVTHQVRRGHSDLVVIADDVPGLLAKVTGVLFANRIDILDAAIYSREPTTPGGRGEALDIFRIRRAPEGAVTDESRIAAITRDLEAVLEGRTTVEALVAARPVTPSIFERAKPKVPPTEVKTDNEISRDFTVIDVFTEDRPGVLYRIASTLHEQGLDIHRSKVGVEADRVADIFYVRDKATGEKILEPRRLEEIAQALKRALPAGKESR
jgi:[protein-PII] uridylyltransferase